MKAEGGLTLLLALRLVLWLYAASTRLHNCNTYDHFLCIDIGEN